MRRACAGALWLGLAAARASAQTYEIPFWTADGGGSAPVAAGAFLLSGTAGQPDAGSIAAGGPFATTGGIWSYAFLPTSVVQVDLAITKTDGLASVVPGTPLVYTIVATNAGPGIATGASVVDVLPSALTDATWTCAASPGSSCPATGAGSINAAVSLLVGGNATFTVGGTVSPDATGTISNRAIVAAPAGTIDPLGTNNSASDVDALTPSTDLSLAIADDVDPIKAGQRLTYTLSIGNAGPSTSAAATVTDALPAGVSFVSGSPGCAQASGVVTCGIGALAPGDSVDVTVAVAVHPTTEGVIQNGAAVAAAQPDPVSNNDGDRELTQVLHAIAGELHHAASLRGDLRGVGAGEDRDDYRLVQEPLASYEVVVDEASGDVGTGSGPLVERVDGDGVTVLQSAVPVGSGPARSLRWVNDVNDVVADDLVRVRSAGCGSDCGADDTYRLRAYETTGRIARFNNAGTQLTVVILQNRGAAPLSGTVHFWDPAGELAHSVPFGLASHGTLVLNAASIPELSGRGGSITIAHDGRFEDLAGKAVALEPSTGFSFDSPLVTRGR